MQLYCLLNTGPELLLTSSWRPEYHLQDGGVGSESQGTHYDDAPAIKYEEKRRVLSPLTS